MRYAVILAGGGGTRLWPASRRATPKQLLTFTPDGTTLLAATARRVTPLPIMAVTGADQAAGVRAVLPDLAEADLLIEPVGRNTAAAIGWAAMRLHQRAADAVIAVLPADHFVADEAEFRRALDRAYAVAEASDVIVTIGLEPTGPETGYGYLELGAARADGSETVTRFIEKPDRSAAESYVASGKYLWNGGMFIARARRLLVDLQRFLPAIHAGLSEICAGGAETAPRIYPTLESVSIDYGVMERAADVVTVRGRFGWHDVGSWSALGELFPADPAGNIVRGRALLVDSGNNIVVSDEGALVAALGVNDLTIVRSGNAVLVMPRQRAQEVRLLVEQLRNSGDDDFC